MKTIKLLFISLLFSMVFTSCSEDADDPISNDEDPLENYNMLANISENGYDVEVYSEQSQFTVGYNELFLRIKDEATDSYISDAEISWMPIMHMTEMMHSCPKSSLTATDEASVYSGYTVFQMAGNTDEYWNLGLEYTINGETYSADTRIEVNMPLDEKARVSGFVGSDESRYIVAMMPIEPEVAVNDFSAMVFKMESMMLFPIVENYTIIMDPRMPGMGNHTSPNNEDLMYDATSKLYTGKLSLTMTGYWKINLKLMNTNEEVLKGENITDEVESSSLYFEIEF